MENDNNATTLSCPAVNVTQSIEGAPSKMYRVLPRSRTFPPKDSERRSRHSLPWRSSTDFSFPALSSVTFFGGGSELTFVLDVLAPVNHGMTINAIVSIQREKLRAQLQQDVQDYMHIIQLTHGHNQNTTLANPEATEEQAQLKRERRKQIKFQLMTREYQEEEDGEDENDNGATNAVASTVNVADITPVHVKPDEIQRRPQRKQQRCATCNICLCEYETGEEVSQGPICHHDFHTECIIDWLLRNEQCPICRQDFLPVSSPEPPPPLPRPELQQVPPSLSSQQDRGDALEPVYLDVQQEPLSAPLEQLPTPDDQCPC